MVGRFREETKMTNFTFRSSTSLRGTTLGHPWVLGVPLLAAALLGAPVAMACSAAEAWLESSNGRHVIEYLGGGEEHRLTVPLDRPGELWVEVGAASGYPLIDAPGHPCTTAVAAVGLRLPQHLMVEVVEPGDLVLSVTSQDPAQDMEHIVTHVLFRDTPPRGIERDGTGDVEDPEDEHPPEIILIPSVIEPFGGCRDLLEDDVADTQLCAFDLVDNETIYARIGRPIGVDRDVFAFHLEERSRVVFEMSGTVETRLGLYDALGLLLAEADDDARPAGRRRSSRLARVLPPGRYFVSVDGLDRSPGGYGLTFQSEPR